MKNTQYIIVFFILLISSCSNDVPKPEPFFEHEEMVDIISDLSMAEGARQYARPTQRKVDIEKYTINDYYSLVFEKHKVTEAQFDSISAWYTLHPMEYDRVYKDVMDRLNKLMAEEKNYQKEKKKENDEKMKGIDLRSKQDSNKKPDQVKKLETADELSR